MSAAQMLVANESQTPAGPMVIPAGPTPPPDAIKLVVFAHGSESSRQTLRRAVLIPVICAALVAVVFLVVIHRLLSESEWLRHSDEVIAVAERIRERAVDMETDVRGYLLTRDRRFFASYDHGSAELPSLLRRLAALVGDNPEQKRRVSAIDSDIAEWRRFANATMRSAAPEQELMAGNLLMDRVRSDSAQLLQAERVLSIQRARRVRGTAIGAVAVTVTAAIVAAAILTFFIRRQLRGISIEYEGALAAAEQLALAKDRMLAIVSHELRTPLTSILGWATLVRSQGEEPEMTHLALASIEQSARLEKRLVEDLIDISKAATGKLRVDLAKIDLRQVLEAALGTMKPAADAKGVLVSTSISGEDLGMLGDAARLQQVFWNLLSNAVRFTPPGGNVAISACRDNGYALLRVTDTGVGIERGFLPRVFEPFAQQNQSSKSDAGFGLGLAIARNLVELHGGSIAVNSEGPGQGAEFSVRLPLPPAGENVSELGPRRVLSRIGLVELAALAR